MNGLFYFNFIHPLTKLALNQMQSEMIFDFAINCRDDNTAHLNTACHHNMCIHLYFFHFVKEQSS